MFELRGFLFRSATANDSLLNNKVHIEELGIVVFFRF